MARTFAKRIIALGALAASGTALACADGGCDGTFNLIGNSYSCQGRAMLAPGNDSRINLMYLLADHGGRAMVGLKPISTDDDYNGLGSVFLDWRMLRRALFPVGNDADEGSDTGYYGSRCMSFAAGSGAVNAAMLANRGLPLAERTALSDARAKAEDVCKQGAASVRWYGDPAKLPPLNPFAFWPVVKSRPGSEFLGYLQASDAFYAEHWDDARKGYTMLAGASDPFVRETAAYMMIRVEFAAAQAPAFGDYGSYDGAAKVDRVAVKQGLEALATYLKTWPTGRYAGSAQGLLRRGLWLAGNYDALGTAYSRMLDSTSPQSEAAVGLVEEIDTKLLFNADAKDAGAQGAILLAAQDLINLRDQTFGDDANGKPVLSAAALDAQAPRFAGQGELFSFLQATHAYYYGKDYRKVLQLIPDSAKQLSFSNLAFSRQVLRGMALAGLGDRNEAGFWQDLLGGANGLAQRPLVELGLAMNWERHGKLDAVFAPGSPITDPSIRSGLIEHSASPALLRTIVQTRSNSPAERDSALFALLSKQLVRGQYSAFAADLKLPVAQADAAARNFVSGKVADGYSCAPLAVTAAALARNPQDIPGRLCLGDFFRLHDLDYMGGQYDSGPKQDELGGFANGFPERRNFRSEFYRSIIADPRAASPDKAYALYRAVMCYAPSGVNDCGGNEVPKAQRKGWYDQLKRDYPASAWSKKLRYYW